jgi:hypothetical protein
MAQEKLRTHLALFRQRSKFRHPLLNLPRPQQSQRVFKLICPKGYNDKRE